MTDNVRDDARQPVAYEQLATATATGLTAATHFGEKGAKVAIIQAITADVIWRDDGTDPTAAATGGMLLATGESFLYTGQLNRIKFINAAAASGAVVNVSSYR
jgi:hypothetical protein